MEQGRTHQFDPSSPEAAQYNNRPDFSNVDFNDPASFIKAQGGGSGTNLPIPDLMTPADVRRIAEERTAQIFASHEVLHEILLRHEGTLQRRWTKRTKQHRLRVLLEAWPDMPATHRPDFEAFRKETPAKRDVGTAYKAYYMWPYINQEDLSKPMPLLLMLNSRGRHQPWEFAAADIEAMSLGLVTKALVPIFLNGHVMTMNGVTTASDYGKVIAWDEHPDAFDWMHTRKQLLPGEGLMILEAQQRVLGFLVLCCQKLLADIPKLTGDLVPLQPEPPLKSDEEITGFESLVVMTEEAPYRLPAKLDFRHVESLLAARLSAAEDHLWSLREDPGYFAEQLVEAKEHRLEMLKDTRGDTHPMTKKSREHILWERVIGSVLVTTYVELEVFSELHRQSQELSRLQAKYCTDISPYQELPEEYLGALLRFRYFVDQAAKGPINKLKETVAASPPMRALFVREPPTDSNSSNIAVRDKPGLKKDRVEERLVWLLHTLWEDGHNLFLARLPLVIDELERLCRSEPRAKALVNSTIAGIIGDLSIISQCRAQIDLYQPWANSFDHHYTEWEDEVEAEFKERSRSWGQILAAFRSLPGISELGQPSQGRFTYPIEKRRTNANVATLRHAEANLDAFWAKIDGVTRSSVRDFEGTASARLQHQPRILQRTPEWVEPESTKVKPEASDLDFGDLGEFSALSFHSTGGMEQPVTSTLSRSKIKTRGTPAPIDDAVPVTDRTSSDPQAQAVFTVGPRALKVLRMLFFNPAVTSTPGEIPWKDFLHAMTATGFLARKLYGSAWQFRPTTIDRPILFHEPHPNPKIPFTVARRFGRRLNRAYGWDGDMFVGKGNGA